jgi:hypothetical protein
MSVIKSETSRMNGNISQGPVTLEGKARSAQNATKHGLTGGPTVLPGESQAEYDAFLRSFIHQFSPVNPIERDLVDEMASSRWRLRRIARMENALMQQAINKQVEALGPGADPDFAQALALADLAENSKGMRMLDRYSRTLRRSYEKAHQELLALQSSRPEQNEPEPDYSVLPTPSKNAASFLEAVLPYVSKQNAQPLEIRRAA